VRLGGKSVAGYFPAPVKVVRAIGALLQPERDAKKGRMNLVDPCAGDGLAIVELAAAIERVTVRRSDANIFACEMEASRHHALAARLRRDRRPELGVAVHSDAFRVQWETARQSWDATPLRAGLGYFNPPYDSDKECGRLEERWLRHFLSILHPTAGILVYLLPAHALAASADTLARNFTDVAVYRFPDPHYDLYKQVVVLARRRPSTYRPDPVLAAHLRAVSETPTLAPVLPMGDVAPVYTVPTAKDHDRSAEHVVWQRRPLDADGVAAAIRPWRHGAPATDGRNDRLVPGVLPDNGAIGYATEAFTVALPIRPGHVANALAVGVFDGVRVVPDDKASGLPPVFAKATFVKDWVDVKNGERRNENGDVIAVNQVQQPRLVMTALDLRRGQYVKLETSLSRRSKTDIDKMSVADFVEAYNAGLLATLRTRCKPLYDPEDPATPRPTFPIARPLWKAQEPIVAAQLLLMEKYGAGIVEGQTGCGKTSCGCAIAAAMTCKRTFGRSRVGARRTIVICPPHLLAEWADEIPQLLPTAEISLLDDIPSAEKFFDGDPGDTPRFGLMAETTSKLQHAWVGIGDPDAQGVHVEPLATNAVTLRKGKRAAARDLFASEVGAETRAHREVFLAKKRHLHTCPACGAVPPHKPKDLAPKRLRCGVKPRVAKDDLARFVERFAMVLAPMCPADEAVTQYLPGRLGRVMVARWAADSDQPAVIEARWQRARAVMPSLVREALAMALTAGEGPTWAVVLERMLSFVAAANDDDLTVEVARRLFGAAAAEPGEHSRGSRMRTTAAMLLVLIRDVARGDALLEELRTQDPERGGWMRWDTARDRFRVARTGALPRSHHPDLRYDAAEGVLIHGRPAGDFRQARDVFAVLRAKAEFEEGEACTEPLYAAVPDPRRVALAEHIAKRWKHKVDLVIIDECFVAGTLVSGRRIEDIRVGDLVDSFDEHTGLVEKRRVARLFKKRANALVRVTIGGRVIVCTPNHPVWTRAGWIPAGLLEVGDEVCAVRCGGVEEALQEQVSVSGALGLRVDSARGGVPGCMPLVQDPDPSVWGHGARRKGAGARVLLAGMQSGVHEQALQRDAHANEPAHLCPNLGQDAGTEPDAGPRRSSACTGDTGRQGAQGAASEGREWLWAHGAAEGVGQCSGVADGGSRPHWDQAEEQSGEAADLVQTGHRKRCGEDRDRGRRSLPLQRPDQGPRSEEGRLLAFSRVDRTEVLEPGSDGRFGGVCPDGHVYNIEVEDFHTYIAGGIVVHNCHEATALDSAQTLAMMQFQGRPLLGLTGSLSNGYAKSLFAVLRAFSPMFRAEFGRDDVSLYVERYGYLKRVLQDIDPVSKDPVTFGTQSARVVRKETITGDAPGTVPSFVLKHFLPVATPLGLEDLELDLPPRRDFVRLIDPGDVLGPRVRRFRDRLMDQIAQDRFTPLQGKLFGAMGEEWSTADRATLGIGNSEDGIYRACYPASVGGQEVAQLEMITPDVLLPKELALIEIVKAELAEGRRCLIAGWHAKCGLYERLAAVLKSALGIETPILDCDRVTARKRKGWLKQNVVDKADTMIVTSAGIETGFNALTWFSTLIWYQPPACAPRTVRQTEGRIRRPGQKHEQRFYSLLYKGTSQEQLARLLQLKAAESIAIDGLDNTSALRAAGVEPAGGVGGFDLGMELYRWAREQQRAA
jgi:hypothetical protein